MNEENKVEEGISLGDLFHVVIKNFWFAVVITVFITLLGAIYTFFIAEEKYKSTSTIVVAITSEDDTLDYNNSSKLIYTITDLVKQDIVINDVAEENNIKPDVLRDMIEIKTATNSYLVNISVVSTDPVQSKELTNDVVEKLIEVINTDPAFTFAKGSIKQTSFALDGTYDSPNKLLYCLISLVGGGVVALVVIFIKEFASNKYTNKKAVETAFSEKIIGVAYLDSEKKISKKEQLKTVDLVEPTIKNFEQYNKLISNIKYSNLENPYKVIMVTSTGVNELKSTTSANLAYSIANNGKKVLIIDLDVRKPVLYKTFKVEKGNGLVEYIEGTINKDSLIKHSESGVDVITAGKNIINPMVIVESKKLKELIKELREEYDYIIIDTPPLALCTDAVVISSLCDGVVFNVALKTSKKQDIKDAIESLKGVNANIIGLNVTKVELSKKDAYYLEYQG